MEPPPLDDLAFLGLTADTDLESLKSTRNALIKSFHPDRFHTPHEKAEAHEQAIRINAAYERIRKWLESSVQNGSSHAQDAEEQDARDSEAEQSRRARAEARRQEETEWESSARNKATDDSAPPPPASEPAAAAVHPPRQRGGFFQIALAMLLVLFGVGIGLQLRSPPLDDQSAPPVKEVAFRETATPKAAAPSATVSRPATMPAPVVRRAVGRPGDKFWEADIGEVSLPPVVGINNWIHVATKSGTVHTFHERSGLLRWKTALGTNVLFLVRAGNSSLAVATADRKVHVLDEVSGAMRWVFQDKHNAYALLAGPGELVYLESNAGQLYALDIARQTLRWTFATGARTAPPVLGWNDILYVSRTTDVPLPNGTKSMKQDVVALDANTGKRLWEFPPLYLSSAVTVASDGTVFVHAHTGTLYALNFRTGEARWQNPLFQGMSKGSPTLSPGGDLVVTDNNGWKTYAINSSTGAREWEFWWGKLANRRILGSDGTIYLTSGQYLCAVNTAGTKIWEKDLDSPILGMASLGTTTYATTAKGILFALDILNGQLYWDYPLGAGVTFTTPPVLTPQQTVLLASADGKFSAIAGGALHNLIFRTGGKANASK